MEESQYTSTLDPLDAAPKETTLAPHDETVEAQLRETSDLEALEGDGSEEASRRRYVFDILFNKTSQRMALIALPLSFLIPSDGIGFSICWFYNLFEYPCPGCGLTRAVANISRLDFASAWDYHPFGIPIYLLILMIALSSFLPRVSQKKLRDWFVHHEDRASWIYWAFVGSFLVFGFARLGALVIASPP